MPHLQFKQACTTREFEQIHRLNHQIFADEIRQHVPTPDGRLVDRFNAGNRYFIATYDDELAGMVSVHPGPEFSVSSRLSDPDLLLAFRAPLEVRLLAVDPRYRRSLVLPGLSLQVYEHARDHSFSDLLISGITTQLSLYRKMGFHPLGPPVPSGSASFAPMHLPLDSPPPELSRRVSLCASRLRAYGGVLQTTRKENTI